MQVLPLREPVRYKHNCRDAVDAFFLSSTLGAVPVEPLPHNHTEATRQFSAVAPICCNTSPDLPFINTILCASIYSILFSFLFVSLSLEPVFGG
jgi:hypothetical protein